MSRDREFRVRDKTVHKMSRDGLVEQNQTTGTEQRISGRIADVSFDKSTPPAQTAGHRQGKSPEQPHSKQRGTKYQQKFVEQPPTPDPQADSPVYGDLFADYENQPMQTAGRVRTSADTPPKGARRKQAAPPQPADVPPAQEQAPSSQSGRLHFNKTDAPPDQSPDGKPRRSPQKAEFAAKAEGAPRLQFDKSETASEDAGGTADDPIFEGKADGGSKQQKRYDKRFEKAERRVSDTAEKLEKAKEKLPTKRRIKLEKQYDSDSGKIKRHLQFEKEVLPQGYKGNLLKRGTKAVLKGAGVATLMKGHQKLHQVEKQNTAVEAAHKTEFVAERAVGRGSRLLFRSIRNAPYKRVAKLERKTTKAEINRTYQKALRDNPQLQKSTLAKWAQKRKIKRGYAKAARDAKKAAHHTQRTAHATGQIVRAVAQFVAAHKTVIAGVALVGLMLVLMSAGISSCTAMLSGISTSIISTMYMSDEEHIDNSELLYTELETELQQNIDDTERNFSGYDEYRYNIGEISHNPYELMAYLSAVYDIFTFDQVQGEIRRLFSEQYTLSREQIVEVRYRTETSTDPITGETTSEEVPYNWYVLQTTLSVRPLSSVIAESLPAGDSTDRYGVYMQTYGNRQAFGNPFSFPWMAYISSPYGYRVHPITGAKDLHRGMDIAVAGGTPIQAVHDGKVVFAGDAGGYGLCVVIEDEKGYLSRYAHCSSYSVSVGQEVKKGDVIAAVGSTGDSTGNHLHLEVSKDGQYLNPYYFVDTGASGPGGAPDIPSDSGSPMGDGSYAAMIAEAEKYLGYPYVWGGSSPSTSFDCSGYVSWVINQSGVGSVGRQTAQGLFNICTPVSTANAKPGDLIFFTGTYSSPSPVSHIGIYVGGGRMIHCGDPISYANVNSSYWQSHFYAYGRLP